MAQRLCFAACLVAIFGVPVQADFSYPNFAFLTDLVLVGDALQVGDEVHLVQTANDLIGGLYRVDQEIFADGFDVEFIFRIPADGADGFAFIIQNENGTALQTNSGTTIGYATATVDCNYSPPSDGITSCVAVEFDTWDSGPCMGEPGTARHVAVHSSGVLPASGEWPDRLDGVPSPANFEDGIPHNVRVLYDPVGPVLRVYLDDLTTSLFDVPVDLPGLIQTDSAWVGFTAATGGVTQVIALRSWSYSSTVPLTNDDCLGAIEIEPGEALGFSTSSATADGVDPGCGTGGSPVDVWYRLVPDCDGDYQVSLCGSAFDTRLAVYDGTAGCPTAGSTPIVCNDDSCGTQSQLAFTATGATTYYIQVGGAGTDTGDGTIAVDQITGIPANDECSGAEVYAGVTVFSTECANSEGIDPGCGNAAASPDIWYEYAVTQNSQVTVSLAGSQYDTVLAVWGPDSGCPSPGDIPLDCNDDAVGLTSEVTFLAVAGQTYLVQITGFSGAAGVGTLEITEFVPPDVTGEVVLIDGDLGGAIDGFAALQGFLLGDGIVPVELDADQVFLGTPETLFYAGGTFPENVTLDTNNLGDTFATLVQAGTHVYVEGGDIWGFDPPTNFFMVDGVADGIADGNDGHTEASGTPGGPLDGQSFPYSQDQAGNDFTDQLFPAGAGVDILGDDTQATLDDSGGVFSVHIFYNTDVPNGKVVSSSTELGGYDGAQILYDTVVSLLTGIVPPQEQFRRGDSNDDSVLDISDAIFTLAALFSGGDDPVCPDAADANDDGAFDISDAIFALAALFSGGPAPPDPGPDSCGLDPTADSLGPCNSLTCP